MNLHEREELKTLGKCDDLLEGLQTFTRGDCSVLLIRDLIAERVKQIANGRSKANQQVGANVSWMQCGDCSWQGVPCSDPDALQCVKCGSANLRAAEDIKGFDGIKTVEQIITYLNYQFPHTLGHLPLRRILHQLKDASHLDGRIEQAKVDTRIARSFGHANSLVDFHKAKETISLDIAHKIESLLAELEKQRTT